MKKILVLIITLALLCVCATVTFGNIYQFAKYGLGGYGTRADAMGGAFLAVADDGFASCYNPAGITQLNEPVITGDIGLITKSFPSDYQILSGFGGITTPSWGANFCFDQYNILNTSYKFIFSKAAPLSESAAWGGNIKLTCGDFYGVNVDSGWLWKPSEVFSWGVVARDIGYPFFESGPSLSVGCAYRESSSTVIAADLDLMVLTWDSYFLPFPMGHLGVEQYVISDVVALRMGFSGFPAQGFYAFTGGMGVKIYGVNADLAIIGLTGGIPGVELSVSHRL